MINNWQLIEQKIKPSLQVMNISIEQPEQVQTKLLKQIIQKNQNTEFGQQYQFDKINNYKYFSQLVPLNSYEDLAPYIKEMAEGKTNVLVAEPMISFEMTGGSSTGAKLIPYTSSGLAAFRSAIFPWLADLLSQRPQIKKGRSYWAISPAVRQVNCTPSSIPIGMSSDADYFGKEIAQLILPLLAITPELATIKNLEQWRYLTALFLLAAADLSFISVWSPTFLLQLVEEMIAKREQIIDDIAHGKYNLPANPKRAKLLRDAIAKDKINSQLVWQNLDTISCWKDASSATFIPQLQEIFPQVYLQGKGLLATEGVVTFPLENSPAPILAINSAFYEFIDDNNQVWRCHQLQTGQIYQAVITTHSGLYRYQLGDYVLVKGWQGKTPCLEFMGRGGLVSDLCGEKLTEAFVMQQLGERRGFTMLAPSLQEKAHYALFLDVAEYNREVVVSLAQQLDIDLRKNPQYDYARDLGQLGAIVAYTVANPLATYIDYAVAKGQRIGDIKPPVMSQETGWEMRFKIYE